jgi:hypothetical protein
MQPRVLQRLALTAVLVLAAGVSVVETAAARPSRPAPRVRSGGFNLFDGVRGLRLNANRVDCNGITNFGNICTDLSGSGTVEAGYWPNGTPDNYVFNGGLQLAGTVQYVDSVSGTSTGPWVGDTVGVFFMDPRGDQREGDAVTNIYSSLNAGDLAVWPSAAYVKDTSLYNGALIGRQSISQQDTWVRYWDGNPALTAGRKHAMGVLVEQRGLLWNFPSGNQDILYFLFRFINITATDPTAYQGLANVGYTASDISDIVSLAQDFHNRVQASYGVTLPAKGFTFHNLFAAFFQDADEGNASFNFSEAILPFAMVSVLKSNYSEPLWQYPASVFSDPFYPAPGYEAVKYLKSPNNPATGRPFGISVWGNTCNGCGLLNDAVGVQQMYRYLAGRVSPALGDGQCNSDPILLHTCASLQSYADTRFFESSGPFDLNPGQSSVIVVAMIFAAPLHKWAATTNGIYAMPAGDITNYLGSSDNGINTYFPGWPATPDTLALAGTGAGSRVCTTNCGKAATIRDPVERPMGWGQFSDVNSDGTLEQDEVQTAPGSLLDKAKVAQAVFDNKFLLPFAPEAPNFYLVPGDGQVTVVWQKSSTENVGAGGGDPYFAVASDPTSALYDPDYRQYDVEGYRIWRGRTAADLQVIAQFDYAGTSFTDYVGQVYDGNYPQCAPEIGLTTTANCAVNFQYPYTGTGPSVDYDLGGNVVQVIPGSRTQLLNGSVYTLSADTAVTGGGSGYPALTDAGVPFAFVDNNGVLDGFQYYYAVTAFDVNSLKSGPSSLQSAIVPKSVVPRANSGQESAGGLGVPQLVGGDGSALDPNAALPTIDPATGIFSGPMPPTNVIGLGFAAFLPQVLTSGSASVTIDSVIPGYADVEGGGASPTSGYYFFTAVGGGASNLIRMAFNVDPYSGVLSSSTPFPATAPSTALAKRYGGDSTFAIYGNFSIKNPGDYRVTSYSRGSINSDPANSDFNGPRWWTGSANESTDNPNGGLCSPTAGDCGAYGGATTTPVPNSNQTAGALTGVDSLVHIQAYGDVPSSPMRDLDGILSYVVRAADFQVYWGANGAIDSVVDVTHHVQVPFSPRIRASWGILNDSSFVNTPAANTRDGNNAKLTWTDIFCVAPAPQFLGRCGTAASDSATPTVFMDHARLSAISVLPSAFSAAGAATLTTTGNGFIFYLNGHFFMMQMAALPAAGTVWNARFYAGTVTGTPGSFAFTNGGIRPAAVPGLQVQIQYQGSTTTTATTDSVFASIHTVPDPYYVTNALETSPNSKVLRFVNVPSQCIIRIYSLSGILVRILTHNDATNGAEVTWDLRNRNNQYVASGVYFYHVQAADGRTKVGRFTVVNFAQ